MHIAKQFEFKFDGPVRWDLIHCPICGRETGGGYCQGCQDTRDDGADAQREMERQYERRTEP